MEYWYAGSGTQNALPTYLTHLQQYLFDASGRLLSTTTLRGDSVTGWNDELPNGSYTLVLWGNLKEAPPGADARSHSQGDNLNELTLSAATTGTPPGYRNNTERLYYGIAEFEISDGVTLRQRVYLSHAHAALSVTVKWMTGVSPEEGTYRMRLRNVPCEYSFTGGQTGIVPSGDGSYTIPAIGSPQTHHETRAALNYEEEVQGEFVTYRYTAATHPLWSLWHDGKQVIKDLDLGLFFNRLPMNMDTNMEQVFDLLVTVYDDRIVVTQVTAADWDEGGSIG